MRLLALLLLCSIPAAAEPFSGRIVAIADGDTLTLLDSANVQHKIRLAGIDAPEKRQPFGTVSKKHLSDLAFGRTAEADCYKRDRYKRQICIVSVNGKDVGLAQLDAGLAWVYRQYVGELYPALQVDYRAAEDRAAANGFGLWRDRDAVPPWEWRKRR
jgi:endonuclease YncB( thermonuclease family)